MHRRLVGRDGPERLAGIQFFAGLTDAERRMLARLVDELVAEPGEQLMSEGEYGREAIFIEQGTAEVRREGELINTVGPGEIVGELALVDPGGRRTASVIASSQLQAMGLTSHVIHEIQARMPDLAAAIDRAAEEHHERDRRRQAGL